MQRIVLPMSDDDLVEQLRKRDYSFFTSASLESEGGARIGAIIQPLTELYEPLLLATATLPKRWYDWNVGFILRHLDSDVTAQVLEKNRGALAGSEGIAWGLGEAGSDDERIVDYLYHVCESCGDYDAWWCAAEALEKLVQVDATDLKKRTLKGEGWKNLDYCFEHLDQRPAVIGILRLATAANTDSVIVPRCREALTAENRKTVQNAVWLLERLRVDDVETLSTLLSLYEQAEDYSHTLQPRIVEALGHIAAPRTRSLLELALGTATYYRTRAYAAIGLGRIGDTRSLICLEQSLRRETDDRVFPHITAAMYSIQHETTRHANQSARAARWPENGMVADESNKWYGAPAIYDRFSQAEDPLGLTLEYALSLVPDDATQIADLGTGTGRFAMFIAEKRAGIDTIYALDASKEMHEHLTQQIRFSPGLGRRVKPLHGRNEDLPFESGTLDAVVSSWAFPSSLWKPDRCLRELREVRRVLRPGGRLVTVGWDETFRDELSELWYRFVPEPDFRRESIEEWRRRRRQRLHSPRNCHLTWTKRQLRVPLLFDTPTEAATILGHLFGYSAGEWVAQQRRSEFSIYVGVTCDDVESLDRAIANLTHTAGE